MNIATSRCGQLLWACTRLAAATLPDSVAGQPLYLRIRARGDRYEFQYALEEGRWRTLLAGSTLTERHPGPETTRSTKPDPAP